MGIWIRTQDRNTLLEVNNVYISYNGKSKATSILNFENERIKILGEYETEERALEVLDEIESILTPRLIIKGTVPSNFEISKAKEIYTTDDNVKVTQLPITVYRMPKE